MKISKPFRFCCLLFILFKRTPLCSANADDVVPDEYLVMIKKQFSVQKQSTAIWANRFKGQVLHEFSYFNALLIRMSKLETKQSILQRLSNDPTVSSVEPNYLIRAF